MLIKPSQTQKFCPNCENQFQNGYDVFSYTFPGYKELYTDGHFVDIWGGEEETWIIQCPKCKQYFSVGQFIKRKKSLSENRMFKKFDDEELEVERERYRNLPKIESIHGLQTPAFWDSIIKQGLFYPETATEKEKQENLRYLYIMLWRSCNHSKTKDFSEEFYNEVVNNLLELCDSGKKQTQWGYMEREEEDKIIRAEIYRNRGEFEKALKEIKELSGTAIHKRLVNAIKELILEKKKETCAIPCNDN